MSDLLNHVTKLLRYGASGFFCLVLVAAIDNVGPNAPNAVYEMKQAMQSWWPVLFLALVIGVLTYSLHLTILFRLYAPLRNLIVFKVGSFSLGSLLGWDNPHVQELRAIRWLLRVGHKDACKKTLILQAKQRLADEWSAHIHLLFCCFWVTLGATIIMNQLDRFDANKSWWCFVAMFLFVGFGVWNDLHCENLKREILRSWKIVNPEE